MVYVFMFFRISIFCYIGIMLAIDGTDVKPKMQSPIKKTIFAIAKQVPFSSIKPQ